MKFFANVWFIWLIFNLAFLVTLGVNHFKRVHRMFHATTLDEAKTAFSENLWGFYLLMTSISISTILGLVFTCIKIYS